VEKRTLGGHEPEGAFTGALRAAQRFGGRWTWHIAERFLYEIGELPWHARQKFCCEFWRRDDLKAWGGTQRSMVDVFRIGGGHEFGDLQKLGGRKNIPGRTLF